MLRIRPPALNYVLAAAALLIVSFVLLRGSFDSPAVHNALWAPGSVGHGGATGAGERAQADRLLAAEGGAKGGIADLVKHGGVIMPRLPNATAKAELGRASWKLLHTMAARFPEEPTADERDAFKSFLFLFSRLYPCGECAAEFQALLRQHPPQTSSRTTASMYLCHLHNLVNLRLGKPEFDCSADLEGVYDCGCGGLSEEEKEVGEKGRIGTGLGGAGGGDEKGRKEVKLDVRDEDEAEREDEGQRRDPQTGLELVGG
ncbi:hypothetical protein JCM10213_004849 [Rhodosporidiobolus nylandii]